MLKKSTREITICCDNPYCRFETKTSARLRFSDVGVQCPECDEVMLTFRDVLLYKALGILHALRIVRAPREGEKHSQFRSR